MGWCESTGGKVRYVKSIAHRYNVGIWEAVRPLKLSRGNAKFLAKAVNGVRRLDNIRDPAEWRWWANCWGNSYARRSRG